MCHFDAYSQADQKLAVKVEMYYSTLGSTLLLEALTSLIFGGKVENIYFPRKIL